jgi:LacI family transcriptional regulator
MAKRFGTRNIAEITGYSVATVSRVLNKKGNYSEDAEAAILKVAEKYNYHPHVHAKGLKSIETRYIGILIPDITIHFYFSLAQMIQIELIGKNYYPIYLNVGPKGLTLDKGMDILLSLKVAGIICISSQIDNSYLDQLNIPVVYLNRIFTEMDKLQTNVKRSSVSMDYRQGSALAAKELFDKGCKKVTFITTEYQGMSAQANQLKQRSFQEVAALLGMQYVHSVNEDPIEGVSAASYIIAKTLFETHPEVDGIYCGSDYCSVGVVTYLREQGIEIPESVQVISFGQTSGLEIALKAFSAIVLPEKLLAREASTLIIELLEKEDMTVKEVIIPVSFYKGATAKS